MASIDRLRELEEAEELLIKICEYVNDITTDEKDTGNPLYYLDDIPGLKEWWAKHKPKTEREKKLEKIRKAVRAFQIVEPTTQPIEEVILKALEE